MERCGKCGKGDLKKGDVLGTVQCTNPECDTRWFIGLDPAERHFQTLQQFLDGLESSPEVHKEVVEQMPVDLRGRLLNLATILKK
jgi:hypothetical protein